MTDGSSVVIIKSAVRYCPDIRIKFEGVDAGCLIDTVA